MEGACNKLGLVLTRWGSQDGLLSRLVCHKCFVSYELVEQQEIFGRRHDTHTRTQFLRCNVHKHSTVSLRMSSGGP